MSKFDTQDFLRRCHEYSAPFIVRATAEFDRHQSEVATNLTAGNFQHGIGAALHCVTSGGRLLGYQVAATGAPPDPTLVSKVLAYGGWAWGALHAHFEREGLSRYGPTSHEDSLVWLYCLARSCGCNTLADWLARYIYNCFKSGTIDSVPGDVTFNNFMWMLFRAIDKKTWPSAAEVPADVGIYRELVLARDPDEFNAAATAVYEFAADCLDAQPDPDGDMAIYEFAPWGIIPLDVLALAADRSRLTGEPRWSPSGHPLLEPPFTTLPHITTAWTDDLTILMTQASLARFGEQWQAWPPLERVE